MGCRHRRVKKAVAAINRAKASGDRDAVRQTVDRAKRLNPGQRDSERELRSLTGHRSSGAGTSRPVRPRNVDSDEDSEDNFYVGIPCARNTGSPTDHVETQETDRVRDTNHHGIPETKNKVSPPTPSIQVLMPDGGSCVARKDEVVR